jgi:hypothetical protein
MANDAFVRQGGEVLALARAGCAEKRTIGKAHSLSARFTRYRLQSFGNLCDIRARRESSVPFLRENNKTTPFPLEQTHKHHRKIQTHEYYRY